MTAAHTEPLMEARVAALVRRFSEIGERNLRDLPVYNPSLHVEAVGFRPLGTAEWIGVLITPWFMNLMLLPRVAEPWRPGEIGRHHTERDLPAHAVSFTLGGDETLGSYWGHSLASPMHLFRGQSEAVAMAQSRLDALYTPPPPRDCDTGDTARRGFLRKVASSLRPPGTA